MAGKDEAEMKPWQHGIPIEILKDIEGYYKEYNTYSCSPFSEVKKHRIAESIASGVHRNTGFCRYDLAETKTNSKITMYGDVVIGERLSGDVTITKLTYDDAQKTIDHLRQFTEPCWAFAWADWEGQNEVLRGAGFREVGSKITSFAEIYRVYFREGTGGTLFESVRQHPVLDPLERSTLDRMPVQSNEILPHVVNLREEINALDLEFTDHYSNYNDKHSWGALSIRGYSPDPAFITKPEEMNKKWHGEHFGEDFALQDTALRAKLPAVERLLDLLPGIHHRVRLMRLTPNGGELRRHTDQVDPDAGVAEGQLLRFHFPIITNHGVEFTMWDTENVEKTVHMEEGSLWAIDTRKPHTAINTGNEDRIHLVVDVEANPTLRRMVYDALYGDTQ